MPSSTMPVSPTATGREFDITKNSILYMRMSSGGGYGDPLDREPERVLTDVEEGLVSRQEAREIYGVMVDGDEPALDRSATQKLRLDGHH